MAQGRVEDGPADVVEVDVDAVRAGAAERSGDRLRPVVDGRVQPELVREPAAFFVRPGKADDATPEDLSDLADQ